MIHHNINKRFIAILQVINNQFSAPRVHFPVYGRRQQSEARNYRSTTKNRHPASSIQHPASSIQHLLSCTRPPASSIQQPAARSPQPAARNTHHAARITLPVSGFTLLEVLIALAIMAIVLGSVYRMHSQTLTMEAANRFYTHAPLLAQSIMAQLEASSSEIVSGDSGDFGDEFPGYSWSVTTEDVSAEALGEDAEDLKRIDVTVFLNENEYDYTIRSYLLMVE
jgi:general secretion pathway protein I